MATVTVGTSATTLDSGSSGYVSITNTGNVQATIINGSKPPVVLWPNSATVLTPTGSAVTATTPSGTTTLVTATGALDKGLSGPGAIAFDDLSADALAGLSGTYAGLSRATQWPMTQLGKKVAAIQTGLVPSGRIKHLYFGDSYGAKIATAVAPLLVGAFGGQVGAAFSGSAGSMVTIAATTGTVVDNATDFGLWPTGLTTTLNSAGASRTFNVGGSSYTCDTIKVIYANAGGGFKVQVDGVDNTTPTVTSDNSLGIATISVTRGAHNVSVVQTSGAPKIVGVAFEDATVSGMYFMAAYQGGIDLSSPTAQAWANWTTFLANVQPDVITWEMKEGPATLAAALDSFITATQAGCSADLVLVQSPPQASLNDDLIAQNAIIRAKAAQYGCLTWDSYSPFGSYARLTALGFNGDGVHVTGECDAYRGERMLSDLGVFDLALYQSRNSYSARAYVSDRLGLGGPNGVNGSLRVINTDIAIDLARGMQLRDAAGVTAFANFDSRDNSGNPSTMPRWFALGFGMAGLTTLDAGRVSVRKWSGANFNGMGLIEAASFAAQISTQTLAANGAVTLDLTAGQTHRVALQANATSSSITNLSQSGQEITIRWCQDATGGRTYAWPANCRFAGGVAPTDTTANTCTSVTFIYDATSSRWLEKARAVAVPTA